MLRVSLPSCTTCSYIPFDCKKKGVGFKFKCLKFEIVVVVIESVRGEGDPGGEVRGAPGVLAVGAHGSVGQVGPSVVVVWVWVWVSEGPSANMRSLVAQRRNGGCGGREMGGCASPPQEATVVVDLVVVVEAQEAVEVGTQTDPIWEGTRDQWEQWEFALRQWEGAMAVWALENAAAALELEAAAAAAALDAVEAEAAERGEPGEGPRA